MKQWALDQDMQLDLIDNIFNFYFFNSYLAVPQPTLGYFWGNSLTNLMLITAFVQFRPEGHQEPCSKVGFLSPAELLVWFELGTYQF